MPHFNQRIVCFALTCVLISLVGCNSLRQWRSKGYKVGPEYQKPSAPVNADWVVQDESLVRSPEAMQRWWTQFKDPVLDELISFAYQNNRNVKSAVFRVLQARYQLAITAGNLFPQSQTASGNYSRQQSSNNGNLVFPGADRITDTWSSSLDLSWELDFWGRIRRSVAASQASYDANVESLDDVLVTLVSDVALTYLEIRSIEERLGFAQDNIEIQSETLKTNETKKKWGEIAQIDVEQATSNLRQTEATIPQLRLSLRRAQNQLCVLLGITPSDLAEVIGTGELPKIEAPVVIDIPQNLLRRRPDIRAAERAVAAQSEQIGIAMADLYPQISLTGAITFSATDITRLITTQSAGGSLIRGSAGT